MANYCFIEVSAPLEPKRAIEKSSESHRQMADEFVRVFPSSSSNAIRNSVSVLHYSPLAEPPIDYTLKPNSKPLGRTKQDVTTIQWRQDVRSPSEERNHHGRRERQSAPATDWRSEQARRNVGHRAAPRQSRFDTEDETALVLEDLDNMLDTEELTLEQRVSRLEMSHGSPLSHSIPDVVREKDNGGFPPQIPVKSNFALRRGNGAPQTQLRRIPIEPKRSPNTNYEIEDRSDRGKSIVAKMYKETERKIDEAVQLYTPEYFRTRKVEIFRFSFVENE
ncbi:hypothetical protein Q1695_012260 [Nippostrongylus brasiliensis]|nr:hypothetical protein Q1695_012260 [Nippostrongylus brasiliensis]